MHIQSARSRAKQRCLLQTSHMQGHRVPQFGLVRMVTLVWVLELSLFIYGDQSSGYPGHPQGTLQDNVPPLSAISGSTPGCSQCWYKWWTKLHKKVETLHSRGPAVRVDKENTSRSTHLCGWLSGSHQGNLPKVGQQGP